MGEEGRKDVGDEVGCLRELIHRSVRSSHDHKVVLHCPPSGRQGNQVVGVHKFGIEVGDDLLGGSTDCQGNISTRGRGA